MPNLKKFSEYLTVLEYAQQKGISYQAVYNAINDNRISVVYIGRRETIFIHPRFLKVQFKLKKEVKKRK